MVAPITGPHTYNLNLSRTRTYPNGSVVTFQYDTFNKVTYRQRPPYTEPLYCYRQRHIGLYHYQNHPYPWETWSFGDCDAGSGQPSTAELQSWRVLAYNKAYSRFVYRVKDTASWAVSIAERKQAAEMMTSRLLQMSKALRALKRGNLRQAGKELGLSRDNPMFKSLIRRNAGLTAKQAAKKAGNLWLEFWFGWSPLVGDIYGTMDILQSPFPYHTVKASGKTTGNANTKTTSGAWTYTNVRPYEIRARIQAWVQVENPNLFLANQLGLVNPAVVALELVPYSWLLGWFVNLEAILSSWTDFVGLNLTSKQVSYRYTYSNERLEKTSNITVGWKTRGERYERTVGSIPGPTLTLTMPDRLSLTRGLTACSLLVRGLKTTKPR